MLLQNKYYEILEKFVGDYTKEIYGRELIGKVNISQKAIALALEELEQRSILKSAKKGNIKLYSLNHANSELKDIISQVELNRKIQFLSNYRILAHIFRHDTRVIGIFGSYASSTQKKESDIDVFIIGNKKGMDYNALGNKFDIEISIKHFSHHEFSDLLKQKNNLCKEIIIHHIIIFGIEQFIDMIWRNYYGFY